jgi:hypothetical protein
MLRAKNMNPRTVLLVGIGIIAVLLVTVVALFVKYNDLKKDPDANAKETSQRIIAEVSDMYIVPTNEEPTVAQVQDKAKLKDQPFFKDTRNGDYILVYTDARLALVYRESAKKLVTVGPIATENPKQQSDTADPAGQHKP